MHISISISQCHLGKHFQYCLPINAGKTDTFYFAIHQFASLSI